MTLQKRNKFAAALMLSFVGIFMSPSDVTAQTAVDPVAGGTFSFSWYAPAGTGLNVMSSDVFTITGTPGQTFDIALSDVGSPGDAFAIEVNGIRLTPTTENGGPETRGQIATAYYSATYDDVSVANATNTIEIVITDSCCTSGGANITFSDLKIAEPESDANDEIAQFMTNRAHALIDAQPKLSRFLSGQGAAGSLNGAITDTTQELSFMIGTDGTFWSTLEASRSETDIHELGYALLSVGAHAYRSDRMIIGGMLQIDKAEQTSTDGVETSGVGALVGPYIIGQIGDHPLFYDARLLYGPSDNEISPLGTYTDNFTSERWLARVGLEGVYDVERFTLFPNINISHVEDSLDPYRDGGGDTVAAQSIALTKLDFGLDFETPVVTAAGDLVLTGGLTGSWIHTTATGLAASYLDTGEDWGARIDIGARYTSETGVILTSGIYIAQVNSESERRTVGGEIGIEYRF